MSVVWVLVAAAAVLLLWPSPKPQPPHLLPTSPVEPPKRHAPTYMEAVAALQTVRSRLSNTEKLGEEQQKSLSYLTLALVEASEK